MKLHNVAALLAVALLALGAAQAKADEIKIDKTYAFGSNTGTPGEAESFKSDPITEGLRLAYHIGAYNSYPEPPPTLPPDMGRYETYASPQPLNVVRPLPTFVPGTDVAEKTEGNDLLGNSFSVDVTGWTYLMVKWADTNFYYYVGDLTGTLTVTNDVVTAPGNSREYQDASHYTLFKRRDNGVADGGLTAVLIGLGLAGLGVSRRYLKK